MRGSWRAIVSPTRSSRATGEVAQPDHRTRPTLEFPPEMDSILTMSDEAIAETLDFPLPPVTRP